MRVTGEYAIQFNYKLHIINLSSLEWRGLHISSLGNNLSRWAFARGFFFGGGGAPLPGAVILQAMGRMDAVLASEAGSPRRVQPVAMTWRMRRRIRY